MLSLVDVFNGFCGCDVEVTDDVLGLEVTEGRVGGGEGAAVEVLATLGLRTGARSGVRGAAVVTDWRFVWPGALEVAGGEVTLAGLVDAGLGATTLGGRDLGAGAAVLGLGAVAFGAGCVRICRISDSFTKRPC